MDCKIPATISDRFQVVSKLGEGGAGAVFQVTRGNETFALKLLLPEVVGNEKAVARFVLEGEILQALNHPNIVKIYELSKDQSCPYLLIEYLPSGSLADLVTREAPMDWKRAFVLCRGVLNGLEAAHAKEIFHRDVKPSNVLIAADGTPKLADFGIAKSTAMQGSKTTTGVIVGSPAYMAPEVFRGRSANARSDIYSTGVMLFEMLSGQLPYHPDFSTEALLARLATPAARLSTVAEGVPRALDDLLSTALEIEPVKRFPSASLFRVAIDRTEKVLERSQANTVTVISKRPQATAALDAGTDHVLPPLRKKPRAQSLFEPQEQGVRWPLYACAAVTLCLVLAIGWITSHRGRPTRPVIVSGTNEDPTLAKADPQSVINLQVATPATLDSHLLKELEAMDQDSRAATLHRAWRGATGPGRDRLARALIESRHEFSIAALVDRLTDTMIPLETREACAMTILEITAGESGSGRGRCPDPQFVMERLCGLLVRTIREGETAKTVKASIRCLGWLGHPGTRCVSDLVRAPSAVSWVGRGPADDPATEIARALSSIETPEARKELKRLKNDRR